MAVEVVRRAIHNPHSVVLIISAGDRQARRLLSVVKRMVWALGIRPDPESQTEIGLPNGSQVVSLPMSASTIRGYPATDIYIDEFAHFKQDAEIFGAIQPSMARTDRRRTLTICSTPLGKQGEFWRLWDSGPGYSRHQIDIYQAIDQGCPLSVEQILQSGIDDLSFRQEYCCEFLDEETSFFSFELLRACHDPDLYNHPIAELADGAEKQARVFFSGYDPGKKVDDGVFICVEKAGDRIIVRHIREFHSVLYSGQLAYIQDFCRETGSRLLTDETGVGGKIQEDLRAELGGIADGIIFTNQMKEKIITDLHVLAEDKKVVLPFSQDYPESIKLTNQLHSLRREILPQSKLVRYSHEEGKHDDYVWALALAVHPAISRAKFKVDFI